MILHMPYHSSEHIFLDLSGINEGSAEVKGVLAPFTIGFKTMRGPLPELLLDRCEIVILFNKLTIGLQRINMIIWIFHLCWFLVAL